MKSTSHYALAAAAGLFVGALAFTPAQAADLGGDCCADLEERVAELEATTVRKGNRVVSLQLYGQVNKALLIWDDGEESDAYVVDGDYSGSRMGARGTATIHAGWTAGYLVEWEFQTAASNVVSQDDNAFNGDGDNGFIGTETDVFRLRKSNVYVENDQFGRVTIGMASAATDGIAEITLGNTFADGFGYYNSGFFVRHGNGDGDLTGITWGDIATDIDGPRADVIRYDSPSLYGFVLSASWGENDFWDVALRFAKEWNSVRVAAGIGYAENQEQNLTTNPAFPDQIDGLSGSISVMHTPSGIFGSFMAGTQETDRVNSSLAGCETSTSDLTGDNCVDFLGVPTVIGSNSKDFFDDPDDATFYYGQLGIEKNWTGYGASTLYIDYGVYNDFGVGRWYNLGIVGPDDDDFDFGTGNSVADDVLTSSEVTRYGIGVAQKIDSAAMDLYAVAQWYEADLKGADTFLDDEEVFIDDTEKVDTEDWFSVILGSRIQF